MAYWERRPIAPLRSHVEAICFSTDPTDGPSPPIRVVPDGRIDLIVSVAENGDGRAELFGVRTEPLWVESDVRVANVGVRFRPGTAAALLRARADELTDRRVAASGLLGDALVARAIAAPDLAARSALLERALLAWLPPRAPSDTGLVAAAVAWIERDAGRGRTTDLARALAVGERRLERAFRAHVGVGPKTFARITRFRAAWRALERGDAATQVALARGYFDQAHLIRDFRAFAGDAPRRIFPSRPASLAASLGG